MGSNFNFNGFGSEQPSDNGGNGRNFQLTREPSIYSLTFDEFQTAVGGNWKDFGSMNMDEFLKNIWSAEETHNMGSTSGAGVAASSRDGIGYLQRQGSLRIPRTMSRKTVDEVWQDILSNPGASRDAPPDLAVGGIKAQRQPTLGETTLEEFLMKAGLAPKPDSINFFGNLSAASMNNNSGFMYPQQQSGLMSGLVSGVGNPVTVSSQNYNLGLDLKEPSSSSPQKRQSPLPGFGYGVKSCGIQSTGLQSGGGLRVLGLGTNGVTVAAESPFISSNGMTFSGRGRKIAALEKVVERRQRRMIKNRESAARSRAGKQAYTTELEEEIAKLKEENEVLVKKQVELVEVHKKQVLEMMKQQKVSVGKRRGLRRTLTGAW